ncbi:MAG: bifunctional [glutamine synthetase] adenylyltransferase/[glutamine synthetase]-adenylyl-L-tyrosine phosphorylase [Rhodobacteraceae bacterium]|nr:bifunctional [glutamine synthetase] adenylyltransferase/[glutamine synthetase]-adenylyl-L-tyrosine phosphorylase [Paracoccaceae bacterium]
MAPSVPPEAALDGSSEAARALLSGACAAPFLRRTAEREAAWLSAAWERPAAESLQALLADVRAVREGGLSDVEAAAMLRVARRRAALLIALADLGGVWDLDAVTAALTQFADAALSAVIDRLLAQEAARGAIPGFDPEAPAYVILAMGKLGAGELNYSSDIDLIALFDQDRLPEASLFEAKHRFNRLTQQMVKALSEMTADGYVARVDLRLRPDPGATPACLSMAAAETYYEGMGRTWERAAHIKARPVAGDLAAGAAYLERLTPFVWRRHLDFAAVEDAIDMLSRIRAHEGGGEIAVAGQDVKLGAGGIREIELLAQTRQLVLGGRDPSLRSSRTRDALADLTRAGRLPEAARDELSAAYVHLRTLEHRLQMVEDQQTHRMPTDPQALERVAALMGAPDWPSLERETRAHMQAVRAAAGEDLDARPANGAADLCGAASLPDPARAESVAKGWFSGRLRAMRTPRARQALERLTPGLFRRLADAPDPMAALMRFDRFLNGLPAGVQLLALIEANPRLLDLLIEICGAAPRLADYLAHRSAVLDAVLDEDFFAPPPLFTERLAELALLLDGAEDYERALDAARRWAAERRFQIGVGLLRGTLPPAEAGPAYSDIAEVCLSALWPHVVAEQARQRGGIEGGGAAVVAMGRLGSREMTATSDLDLIVVYDAPVTAESEGPRPQAAAPYFAGLTQKLTAALTAPTAEGALYEVDMRLRPSGRSGPLATSLASFARYQREDAWVWEHLALTRARVVAGAPDLTAKIDAAIEAALARPRSAEAVRTAAVDMRAKIQDAHPRESGDKWSVKHPPGGLFDIEFVAQTELLIAASHGDAGCARGGWSTQAAIAALAAAGRFTSEEAAALEEAYSLQAGLQHMTRVTLEAAFSPNAAAGVRAAILRAAGSTDLDSFSTRLDSAQAAARRVFEAYLSAR